MSLHDIETGALPILVSKVKPRTSDSRGGGEHPKQCWRLPQNLHEPFADPRPGQGHLSEDAVCMILMILIMALPVIGLLVFFFWPLRIALPTYLLMVGVAVFYHWVMMKTLRLPVRSGARRMLGSTARVLSWDAGWGQVTCCGEIWRARSENGASMRAGDSVVVVATERLTLVVDPPPDVR